MIVFFTIRSALPKAGVLPTFNIPRKAPPSVFIPPIEPKLGDVTPFVVSSASSDKTFGTKDRYERISDVPPLPIENAIIINRGGTFKGRGTVGSEKDVEQGPEVDVAERNSRDALIRVPSPPSPPVDRHEEKLHSRQNSTDSIRNPFGDDNQADSESESEDEYDGYGQKRGRPDSEWHPSLSAYFDNVDLSTAKPEQQVFRDGPGSANIPPVPVVRLSAKANRI